MSKEYNSQPIILFVKTVLQEWRKIKTFSNKKKLKKRICWQLSYNKSMTKERKKIMEESWGTKKEEITERA